MSRLILGIIKSGTRALSSERKEANAFTPEPSLASSSPDLWPISLKGEDKSMSHTATFQLFNRGLHKGASLQIYLMISPMMALTPNSVLHTNTAWANTEDSCSKCCSSWITFTLVPERVWREYSTRLKHFIIINSHAE